MEQQLNNNGDALNKKLATQKAIRDFIILVFVFALVAATAFYLGRTYFESWPIIGTSMEPTIHNDDRVILVKTKKIDYDDVVIFKTTLDNKDNFSGKYLIKRVVGKPGDVIETVFSESDNAWHVYRNGEIVDESHIREAIYSNTYTAFTETVPEGKYFILGDNRNNSHDSHIAGFYAEEADIVGKVFVRYKSLTDFSFLIN